MFYFCVFQVYRAGMSLADEVKPITLVLPEAPPAQVFLTQQQRQHDYSDNQDLF